MCQFLIAPGIGLVLLLNGCLPSFPPHIPGPSSTARTSAPVEATPSGTPDIGLRITDISWRELNADKWRGCGYIENSSKEYLSDLKLGLIGGEDRLLGPGFTHLAPSERAPFCIYSQQPPVNPTPEIEILSYELEEFPRVEIEVDDLSTIPGPRGVVFVTGMMKNTSYGHTFVRDFALTGLDDEDEITGLGAHYAGPMHLKPREVVPFVVLFEDRVEIESYESYSDAVEIDDPGLSVIEIIQGPTLRATDQQLPFVTGLLKNTTNRPHSVVANLLVTVDGDVSGMAKLPSPAPLLQEESRAFSIDLTTEFVPFKEIDWGDDPDIELVIDAFPTNEIAPTPGRLELEIQHFETLGSSIFLRGIAGNPIDVPLYDISIFGAIRKLDGEILSAGWSEGPQVLEGRETVPFVLAMPLPISFASVDTEFDLQAFGMIDPGSE